MRWISNHCYVIALESNAVLCLLRKVHNISSFIFLLPGKDLGIKAIEAPDVGQYNHSKRA